MRVFRHRNDNIRIKRYFYFYPFLFYIHHDLLDIWIYPPQLLYVSCLGLKQLCFMMEKRDGCMLVYESYKCIMILTKQNMQSNVTLSEEVRLNMQLFQKDAWVMNRLRSANASAIQTNLIQSHYLTGSGKVLQLLCSRWTQHNKWKEIYASIKQKFSSKNINYIRLAQLNGCVHPYN